MNRRLKAVFDPLAARFLHDLRGHAGGPHHPAAEAVSRRNRDQWMWSAERGPANANLVGSKRGPSTDLGASADWQDHGLGPFCRQDISLKAKQ